MLEAARQRLAQLIAPTPQSEKAVTIDFVSTGGVANVQYLNGTPGERSSVDRETAFAAAAYIYAAIQYRARNVSEPPLRVYRETDDGFEPEPHQLDQLLVEPSQDYDMGESLWLTLASLDTFGRTVWVKDSDRLSRTAQLMPFMGDEARVKPANGRLFGLYEVLVAGGRWDPKQPEDVVDFRYLTPHSRVETTSPTDVALAWLNVGEATRAHVRQMMQQGMFPSQVLSPHHEWHPDKDEFDRFKAELQAYHQGPANTGKPFVMLGGGKVSRAAFSLKDLVPAETLSRVEANVAAAFGIAPVILGFLVGLENSPWSKMGEARRQTVEDTIVPLWRMIEKALTRQLLRPIDANPALSVRFDLSGVVALQQDRGELIEQANTATFWTLDQRLVHSGQVPVGGELGEWVEAFSRATMPDPNAESSSRVSDDDDDEGDEDEKAARGTSWSIWRAMTNRREAEYLKAATNTLDSQSRQFGRAIRGDEFRAAYDHTTKSIPTDWGDEVEGAAEVLQRVKEWQAKAGDDLAELLMAAVQPEVTMAAALDPVTKATSIEAATAVVADTGAAFGLVDEAAVEFAERHAASSVKGISKTTRRRLAAAVAEAIETGASVDDLAKSIENLVDGRGRALFGPDRARLIAESEVTAVTNGAQRKAMSDFQADDPEALVEKSWLSARDNLVRPEHQDLDDGSYIPVDDAFKNGLQEPGEPRCRCTAIYRIRSRA